MGYKKAELTGEIINCAFEVHNELGFGFLEKVYENALYKELKDRGFKVKKQPPIKVFYKDEIVGKYFCDLIVDDKIIIELKSVETMENIHEVQLVNYLNAIDKELGLLINFGKSVEVKRKYKN
ncbi:MAG: GxxExxY protein [Candidatus Mcinerneyibacterium aminivorans]|uniref:GxxExxY protein n=1 Tax=Candidatus Mcinerneyibacterium aminivorans TaxID=2703815 RepID=A0A5D0MAN0_9BACT|nr:MAG: GxxExxY protein [Candidatus Mcinerneyibacterium aminivorans]